MSLHLRGFLSGSVRATKNRPAPFQIRRPAGRGWTGAETMNPEPTLPAAASSPSPSHRVPHERATPQRTRRVRESRLHRAVVHALATRPALTGMILLEYGLRLVAEALLASARWALGTGTKWALYLVTAGLVSYCTLVGLPRSLQMIDGGGTGAGIVA
jgi:hypothetical protein